MSEVQVRQNDPLRGIVETLVGRDSLDPSDATRMEGLRVLDELRTFLLHSGDVDGMLHRLDGMWREFAARPSLYRTRFRVLMNECFESLRYVRDQPAETHGLWTKTPISSRAIQIPGMMNSQTRRYFRWLGTTLVGRGTVVDMGCWMGAAAACVLEGLVDNPCMRNAVVHAFDAFRWLPWMGRQATTGPAVPCLEPHVSFLPVLQEFWGNWLDDHLIIHESAVPAAKARAIGISEASWSGGPIELLMIDVSAERAVLQATWDVFATSLIPRASIVTVQQYGLLRSHAIRRFFRRLTPPLKILHHPEGPLRSFLYMGAN